ncbi:snRNA-activating protein complex subunit-like [Actinidia eriantha]|uniref:snRNA-activating protein complex subunit-like n=1 Tax=Actinidia eriantha TaxID=165200 RepID=UPI00258DB2FA|nr:snRNA-activating protein complex subunit-like [Actinidia eriantha]
MAYLRSMDSVTKVNLLKAYGDHVPVIYPEVVLCVEVYNIKKNNQVKAQEMLVLGCQFLTELRDKIYCVTDQVMKKAGQYDPSGYFLIENVFCNDLKDSKAIDYSEPILDWFRNSKDEAIAKWELIVAGELQKQQKLFLGSTISSQLSCFRVVERSKTCFCDLRLRIGGGYLYCHQGNCEHSVVIRDMRLIHPNDAQNWKVYPIVMFQLQERFKKCSVCKIYRAEKVTVDDKWAKKNPCYFCKNCYYLLHYANGSLLYDEFSVFDYFHE